MIRKYSFKVDPESASARLDQFLSEKLPLMLKKEVSKAKVRRLIVAGAVYLNGRRVRIASKALIVNAKIDAYIDEKKLFQDGAQSAAFSGKVGERLAEWKLMEKDILFEDDVLIVVNKPAGIPTQPTLDEARVNLFSQVKRFLSEREKIADVYVGLHHRLDRDTSGVVLFTKDKSVNRAVGELFSAHTAQKYYRALIQPLQDTLSNEMAPSWKVKNYLGRVSPKSKPLKMGSVKSGGDFAETDFQILEKHADFWFVEAKPKTGRTHQIRIHLAEAGSPILGDTFYGWRPKGAEKIPRVMLHAFRLTFVHPVSQNVMLIESPLPFDFLSYLKS